MRAGKPALLAAGLGLGALLSACTSSSHNATKASSTTAPPISSSSSSSSSSSTSSVPATTAPSTSSTSSVPVGPTGCTTASLAGSLTNENGAAGSVYYTLVLTNHGSAACILQGWPGVSFVTGSGGQQVGAAARRFPGTASAITVAPGQGAGAELQITQASNYGTPCQITPVTGLRIYPPNQTGALFVAHTDQACANTSDVTLQVGPFKALG